MKIVLPTERQGELSALSSAEQERLVRVEAAYANLEWRSLLEILLPIPQGNREAGYSQSVR